MVLVTDVNGKYSIQATSKDILSFTYVGMAELGYKSCRTENDQCGDEG